MKLLVLNQTGFFFFSYGKQKKRVVHDSNRHQAKAAGRNLDLHLAIVDEFVYFTCLHTFSSLTRKCKHKVVKKFSQLFVTRISVLQTFLSFSLLLSSLTAAVAFYVPFVLTDRIYYNPGYLMIFLLLFQKQKITLTQKCSLFCHR